ncbi:Fe(3+) ions import ATP-binding protein FbpC [Tetrabaena socialis]|uniref:Fe(3+) ions import ATP-binding protein FbpC n=1 Tax=Tetrabaena socialis TaxID=47790 RepID=A0A2J8A5N4_9CHLO|nr:Fe(3+) ions import ATP-binding protein FbpC [Tetrabaena socialis]|eukprot:PNH07815.1 Fe(3+) ions import ATP-binding protein FbpC [Tetrabaena socialis]
MVPLLDVRGLRRDVAERTIITSVSFTLEAGDVLFVQGPSGVGKSLLLRAVACLDHCQEQQQQQLMGGADGLPLPRAGGGSADLDDLGGAGTGGGGGAARGAPATHAPSPAASAGSWVPDASGGALQQRQLLAGAAPPSPAQAQLFGDGDGDGAGGGRAALPASPPPTPVQRALEAFP